MDNGGIGQLGNRLVRVYVASAGKPDRIHGAERGPAQDRTGSDYLDCLHPVFGYVSEGTFENGLSLGRFMLGGCGVFHVSKQVGLTCSALPAMIPKLNHEIGEKPWLRLSRP